MTTILFLALFLIQSTTTGVDDTVQFDESLIAKHTTHFEIRDRDFIGADSLLAALGNAHFVALGELHYRTRLGELTETLLRTLEPNGFGHFAVETGPYSARKLQQLIRAGKNEVSAFYATYSSRMYDIVPIPFFKGETDFRFLAAADSLGYELWGLDQEFYFSYTYLIDELAKLAGDSFSQDQQRLHRKLKRKLYWLDRRNQFRELFISSFHRSCRLKNDADFQSYLESFAGFDNPDIEQITVALRKTLEIYCMAEQGKASEPVRISYFKQNFDRNFEAALDSNPEPKVFLKMGSYHMGRQQSPLNLYDIGNHVAKFAESRDESSVHITYLNRFLDGRDVTGRRGWEASGRFVSFGDKEKWTLTDLRPIRAKLTDGILTGTASSFEITTIQNYDFIIIAPEDEFVGRGW